MKNINFKSLIAYPLALQLALCLSDPQTTPPQESLHSAVCAVLKAEE